MESNTNQFQQFILPEESYKAEWEKAHHQVFEVNDDPVASICPPDQVFKPLYRFLFQVGGCSFAEDQDEFGAWMDCFYSAGDEQFAIVENIGCTETAREHPTRTVYPIGTNYTIYDEAEKALHEPHPFRLCINHYHIFGKSANWGLYLAEWPTLLIIGCKVEFVDLFRDKLNIKVNGFADIDDFVREEFNRSPKGAELLQAFEVNYLSQERKPEI